MKQKILTLFSIGLLLMSFGIVHPKKNNSIIMPTQICNVTGIYTGRNLSSTGASNAITYKLQDNNFAIGTLSPKGKGVTFGGYRNTCDSVILSVYYTGNSCYYLLEGKLSNNGNTIKGNFKNLIKTADFGTFFISKL